MALVLPNGEQGIAKAKAVAKTSELQASSAAMPQSKSISSDAVLYAAGLALACSLSWLGYMALAIPDTGAERRYFGAGASGLMWFGPTAYFAAWQFLVFRNVAVALTGAVLVAAIGFLAVDVLPMVAIFSLGILLWPALIGGPVAVGALVAGLQRAAGDPRTGLVDTACHATGFVVGLFVITLGLSKLGASPALPTGFRIAAGIGLGLCACATHARISWKELCRGKRPRIAPLRVAGLLALIWAVIAAALAAETRSLSALAWPAQPISFMEARKTNVDLFKRAGAQQPGFHAGETLAVDLGGQHVQATIPVGWLGVNARHPGKDASQRVGVSLVPDPRIERQPPSPTTKIIVRGQPSLVKARPVEAREALKHPRLWREFGCAADDASFDGLFVCRQIVFERGDRPHPPLIARLPDAGLHFRVLLDRSGFMVDQTYYLAGPSVWAECQPGRECHFRFPAGERNAVWITMPEAEVHRWRQAIAEANAVVRAAVGFGLASRSMLEQPDPEVLPFPAH